MTAKNEARIKFTAETGEFNAAIKQVDSTMRQLRSEMKLNSAQMATSGQSVALLADKQRILQQESQQLSAKEQALSAKLQAATSIYGANSTEAQRLATQINGVRAAQESVRGKIEQTSAAIERQRQADAQAESAAGRLATAISKQETELEQLKAKYASSVIETGKQSTESKQLEAKIRELNSELGQNRAKLSEAEAAAASLTAEERQLRSATDQTADGFTVAKGIVANFATETLMVGAQKAKELSGEVVDLGMNFETSLSKVQALSGASADDMDLLESKARALGSTTNFTASQVADAFGYMALAGWDTQQSLDGIDGVLTLAQAGEMDLAAASDLLTDYLSAYGLQASDAGMMTDVLAYAQGHANTNTEQLGQAFKNCAANAHAAGMDVQTTTAFISELSNQGLKGSEAGTALAAVMRDMTSKMQDGKIAIGDTSVAVMDASGNYRDMVDIIADVEAATNGMGAADKASALQATFTADSIKGLNLILNAGSGELSSFRQQLYASSGAASDMAATMTDNLSGELAEMQSALEEVGLKVYDKIEEPLRSAVDFVINGAIPGLSWLVENFDKVAPALGAAGAAIAAFAIAANITGLLSAVAGGAAALGGAIGFLATPAGIAALAIAAAAAAVAYLWTTNDGFRDAVTGAWSLISIAVSTAFGIVQPLLSALATFLTEGLVPAAIALVDGFGNAFASIAEGAAAFTAGLLETVQGGLDLVQGVVTMVLGAIVGIFTGDWSLARDGAAQALDGLLSIGSGLLNSLLGVVTGILNAIVNIFTGQFNAALSVAQGVFSGILAFIGEKMDGAKSVVSGALSAISDFFSGCRLQLPSIPLPHFNVSGSFSLDPVGVPSIGVEWYAKGGVLTRPTLFGTNGGRAMVGGEAGPEAVAPISTLQDYVRIAVESADSAATSRIVAAIDKLADRVTVLEVDGREFARATAGQRDRVDGARQGFADRGLAST